MTLFEIYNLSEGRHMLTMEAEGVSAVEEAELNRLAAELEAAA